MCLAKTAFYDDTIIARRLHRVDDAETADRVRRLGVCCNVGSRGRGYHRILSAQRLVAVKRVSMLPRHRFKSYRARRTRLVCCRWISRVIFSQVSPEQALLSRCLAMAPLRCRHHTSSRSNYLQTLNERLPIGAVAYDENFRLRTIIVNR